MTMPNHPARPGTIVARLSDAVDPLDSRLAWDLDRIMTNLPAQGIGGGVFAVHNVERNCEYFSVVHIVELICWQSSWIYTRQEADLVAEMLAFHCKAMLMPEIEI